MGSAWAEKSWDGKALYAFESLFHLLRSLTTPITPPVECLKGNKWNQGFERCTASLNPMCFSAFMAFWLMRRVYGDSYAERMAPWQFPSVGPLPLPVACFVLTTPLGVGVWFLTKSQMPGWLRSAYVVPGFCSAVIWFDIFACELVACLQTFGFIFDIPTSLLGVTILAWGNSIGDFFADRAVARDGYVKMAISGCYGEPNFPRLIGLGLAFLFVTIASSPEPYTQGVQIDAVTVLGFFMQWVVLFTVGVLAVWDNFRLRKQVLGPVLLIQCVPCTPHACTALRGCWMA
jgi:Ca2+/Na+ antiporter